MNHRGRLASTITFLLSAAAVVVFVYVALRHPVVSKTPVGQGTNDYIGRPAPDLTLQSLDGSTVSLSSLKGKVVVLDLWATWCPPCVAELPHVTDVAARYADKGVTFYAVNMQETPDVINAFLARQKLATPVLLDPAGKAAEAFGAQYIPLLVVIDRHGRVVARDNVDPSSAEKTLAGWIESALQSGQAE